MERSADQFTVSEHGALATSAAVRDERIARARQRLAEANDEATRAEAILDELRAKLAFEAIVARHGMGPTPAIAARVTIGDLSVEDAVRVEQASGDPSVSDLALELAAFATAEQWVRFEAVAPVIAPTRATVIERLCAEGDGPGALRLLALGGTLSVCVREVAIAFGRDAVSAFRGAALDAIAQAEAEQGDDPWYLAAQIARLSYALTVDEQRARVVQLATERASANIDVGSRYRIWSAAAHIAIALLDVGERGLADPWMEQFVFTERIAPACDSFNQAHRPVIAALRARSTAEEFAAWEQRLRAFYLDAGLVEPLYEHVSDGWREQLRPIIQARFRPAYFDVAALSALRRDQQRAYVRHKLDCGRVTPTSLPFLRRRRNDPAFEAGLLDWVPRRRAAWKRNGASFEPLSTLLDAAADNNTTAIEALCAWNDADEVMAVPQWSLGLAPAVVRALLSRSTCRPRINQNFRTWALDLLSEASSDARERWKLQHGLSTSPTASSDDRTRAIAANSLANEEDVETLLRPRSWTDERAETAYRALIRCVALRCAGSAPDEPLRELQGALLDRVAQDNFEYWETAMIAAIRAAFDPASALDAQRFRADFVDALRSVDIALAWFDDTRAYDCNQLGIVDALIARVAAIPWESNRVEGLCALAPYARDAAREEAIGAIRAAFRSTNTPGQFHYVAPYLTVEDLLLRWPALAGSTSLEMAEAWVLEKLGGAALVDRAGDLLVALLSDETLGER